MTVRTNIPNEFLAGALHNLGVHFLLGGEREPIDLPPANLIFALAQSTEARLRLALIPLFLKHPDFVVHVVRVVDHLPNPARVTLMCYFTAAMLLQEIHRKNIREHLGEQVLLPDLFSQELAIPGIGTPEARLEELALRHQVLSDVAANWLGTYNHAADTWLKGLKLAGSSA